LRLRPAIAIGSTEGRLSTTWRSAPEPICAGLRLRVGHGGTAACSLDRLDRDANRQRSMKAGLGQRRHHLYLGVAEPVVGVGELVGGKKGAAFAPEGSSPLSWIRFFERPGIICDQAESHYTVVAVAMGVSRSQSAKLVSLATAVPPYVLSQSDVAAAADRGFGGRYDDFERVARVFKSSGIRQRHAVQPIDWYLAPLGWPERTSAYLEGACRLFVDAANNALDAAKLEAAEVDTIVTISSTGVATPSLEARVAGRMGDGLGATARNPVPIPVVGVVNSAAIPFPFYLIGAESAAPWSPFWALPNSTLWPRSARANFSTRQGINLTSSESPP
jgi:hypothetical protein